MPDFLVIKPSSFGDIVHGLQVAETIRRRVPNARFSWIAAGAFAPLVRACATVDEVFEFERRGGAAGFLRLMRAVRARRYDAVLDLQGLARSGLMTLLARGARKIGRRDSREGAAILYRERIALPPGGAESHAIEILLQFLPALGHPAELAGSLEFRAPAAGAAEPRHALLPTGDGPLIAMFPDSRRPEKNWPHFRALTERLLRTRPDLRIAWIGSAGRSDLPHEPGPHFANLLGRTRIDDLPPLIGAADLVVSNDSGPMHLAAAMGAHVLALFGPTPPERFGPYPLSSPRHCVLRAPGGDLGRLSVEEVARAIGSEV